MMGVYIKNMTKPTSCNTCRFRKWNHGVTCGIDETISMYVTVDDKLVLHYHTSKDCPLTEMTLRED